MSTVRRLAVPAVLTCAAVLLPATAAVAAAPERSGWWNRVSAGSAVAPAPTAEEGDLRIAAFGPDEPAAYSAVLLTAPGSPSAALDLEVRDVTGTPEVVACPTTTTDWSEGGNQPYDAAPPYDCTLGSAFGSLSEDGTTLSFALDTTTQTAPGTWSLALVPQPGSASGPFVLDLVQPDAAAFAPAAPDSPSSDPADPGPPPAGASSSSGEPAFDSSFDSSFAAPPSFATGAAPEPLLAVAAPPAAPEAQAPVAAGALPPPPVPLIVARPAGVVEDLGSGRRLLALLVLAGGSAAVGYAAGQQRPGPRLIGGRSRLGAPVPVAAPAGPGAERPRGIGRFAKARDAAPRRLR